MKMSLGLNGFKQLKRQAKLQCRKSDQQCNACILSTLINTNVLYRTAAQKHNLLTCTLECKQLLEMCTNFRGLGSDFCKLWKPVYVDKNAIDNHVIKVIISANYLFNSPNSQSNN